MNDYKNLIKRLKIRSEANRTTDDWWDIRCADDFDAAVDAIEQLAKERDQLAKELNELKKVSKTWCPNCLLCHCAELYRHKFTEG